MNLLLFAADELAPDHCLTVTGRRLQHLLQVHRAAHGDQLRVGEINGRMGHAHIEHIDGERAVLRVTLDTTPPAKLAQTLVLALPRPKVLRRALRSIAEFGVGQIHLINSYRVEKSYWQTPALSATTVESCFLLGLEQCRDTVLPVLHCHRRFKPFVEDVLPALTADRCALLAHPGNHPRCPGTLAAPGLLVVGPEGGFIPYEVEKIRAAGCRPVSLGGRILRVENALSSLLGRCQ